MDSSGSHVLKELLDILAIHIGDDGVGMHRVMVPTCGAPVLLRWKLWDEGGADTWGQVLG